MKKIKAVIGYYNSNYIKQDISANILNYAQKTICSCSAFKSHKAIIIASECYFVIINDITCKLSLGNSSFDKYNFIDFNTKIEYNKDLKINRDRRGVNCIYYIKKDSDLFFSTSIRFLKNIINAFSFHYDTKAIEQLSIFGFILDNKRTIYNEIKKIPYGHTLTARGNELRILKNNYNQYCITQSNDIVESFKEEFNKVISSLMTETKKPVFFLSGGVDSACITIAASRFGRVHTVNFSSINNKSDSEVSTAISNYVHSKHEVIKFEYKYALSKLPEYLYMLENIELLGLFSPLGGLAYFLLCSKITHRCYDMFVPGEGADELFAGYYWPITHPFGFSDKIKEKVRGTEYEEYFHKLFPLPENKLNYSLGAYNFFKESPLSNYHLETIQHSGNYFCTPTFPPFMSNNIVNLAESTPFSLHTDGFITKLILRKFLKLEIDNNLYNKIVERTKIGMPSSINSRLITYLGIISKNIYYKRNHPYIDTRNGNFINALLFDIFHKYFTLNTTDIINTDEWLEDINKMRRYNEPIIHW